MKNTAICIFAAVSIFGAGAALAGDGKEGVAIRDDILRTYSTSHYLHDGRYSAERAPDGWVSDAETRRIQQKTY